MKKIFFFNFFFLIPVKTFKLDCKEPVLTLSQFSLFSQLQLIVEGSQVGKKGDFV